MLKQVYLIIIFCILCVAGYGQNLVPNGDFEYYSQCPTGASQITRCNGWSEYCYTPDFFNSCAVPFLSQVYVPLNFFGAQLAASGNGYSGISINILTNMSAQRSDNKTNNTTRNRHII